jgi:hypothetical protein
MEFLERVRGALSRWKHPKFFLRSLEEFFETNARSSGIYEIHGTLPFHFLYVFKKPSLPLLVFFHGAVDQSKTKLPHFVGTSIAAKLNCNSLHVSDPTLYASQSLRSGWCLGTQDFNFPKILKRLITGLIEQSRATRTVVYGSSGGGFPCLMLATELDNVVAIVNSPCTSILSHPNPALVESFKSVCFPTMDLDEIAKVRRLCFIGDYTVRTGNHLLYLINVGDTYSIKSFTSPFLAQFRMTFPEGTGDYSIPGGTLAVRDWGRGHKHPDPIILIDALRKYLP